jgi:signal transduction histidine kinase
MQAVGQLAAGIAHENNNPMAYVRSNLRMLREELAELDSAVRKERGDASWLERLAESSELLDDSLEGVERTINLVREVKEFSHGSIGELRPVDVSELLEDALRYAAPDRGESVVISRAYGSVPRIEAAPDPLRQVFLNLIVNAFHAVGAQGNVRLSSHAERNGVVVRIEDDGSGIEESVRDRIFEPFFTTKGAGRGTGLGLYFSYEIIRMHGGKLDVRSLPGEGTVFELWLPAFSDPALLAASEH